VTDEEKAATEADAKAKAEAEEKAKAEAASAAAAELAKRRHETERDEGDAPVRMVDLHDVRAELRGEVDKLRRAAAVPHAPPAAPPVPAQRGRGGAPWVLVLVVVVLVAMAFLSGHALDMRRGGFNTKVGR
jgi:hypothetical protein